MGMTAGRCAQLIFLGLRGKSAALDIVSVTSPLKPEIILEVSVTAGAVTVATENRKLLRNSPT